MASKITKKEIFEEIKKQVGEEKHYDYHDDDLLKADGTYEYEPTQDEIDRFVRTKYGIREPQTKGQTNTTSTKKQIYIPKSAPKPKKQPPMAVLLRLSSQVDIGPYPLMVWKKNQIMDRDPIEGAQYKVKIIRTKPLTEEKDYYDFYEIDYVFDLLSEFLDDKQRGVKVKKWRTIPLSQYQKALIEFMQYGELIRFPSKYIDQWADIVTRNTLALEAGTELCGHEMYFPNDEVCSFFDFQKGTPDYEKCSTFEKCYDFLDEMGFYDWLVLPDGSTALSDYGMKPLGKLIQELEEQTTPEGQLVVINKILDVYHMRGDLASAFIEGGRDSLSQISYPDTISINESEVIDSEKNKVFVNVANKLIDELKQIGVSAYIYHEATTGSVYIRFDDQRMGSVRIANHQGRDKLKYKFNIRADINTIPEGRWVKDDGHWRHYISIRYWRNLIDILKKQHEFIQTKPAAKFQYGTPKYKKIMEMGYPASFNMEEFKTIKSFAKRVEYCNEKLQKLGAGSSRIAYKIDENTCLKLAKTVRGRAQNQAEAEIGYNQYYFDHIARVFDYDDDNYLFVEMEIARKCTEANFKEITGYDFNTFLKILMAEQSGYVNPKSIGLTDEFIQEMWDNDTIISQIIVLKNEYKLMTNDMNRLSQYGIVKRDGVDVVVLIDYGLTEKVFRKHYYIR